MTLFNFNLPLGLPVEPAVDAVTDYSPTPAPSDSKPPVVDPARVLLEVLLAKLSEVDLPGVELLREYLGNQYRRNFRPCTLRNTCIGVRQFLRFLQAAGRATLGELCREDLEGFVEHEQDRGLKSSSVYHRLGTVQPFIRYGINQGLIAEEVLKRPIRIKVPERLPRAMEPYDVKCLLAVLDGVRNRSMILVLLRTGMRIGELLDTRVSDVHLEDKKILIYEGEKNRRGRAVCISPDACEALAAWLEKRNRQYDYLFYGWKGQRMSYNNARVRFKDCLTRAGLAHKGYSLHCLRHTFATELLNAGMHLEGVQQLLGHSNLEMTLRYARLSDRSREEQYFKAMAIIEREASDGLDQRDRQLPSLFEASELLQPHS
jgi:site-specific recombinase XerD